MELQDVAGRDDIATLARYTDDPAQKAALDELTGDDDTSRQRYREQVYEPNRSLIDLLEAFPRSRPAYAAMDYPQAVLRGDRSAATTRPTRLPRTRVRAGRMT